MPPLPITVCERCRATDIACEAKRLHAGRPCCASCDHDPAPPNGRNER